MPNNISLEPLINLLERKMIPWVEQDGLQRVLVVRPVPSRSGSINLNPSNLPLGMQVTPLQRRSRQSMRTARRSYHNCSILAGQWPEDRMVALRFPKIICVVNGEADIRLADYIVHCREGQFIVIPPGIAGPDGTSHLEGKDTEHRSCSLLALACHGGSTGVVECGVCHSQGTRHFGKPGEHCSVSNPQVALYFESMLEEVLLGAEGYEKIAQHMLLVLLTMLTREIKAGRTLQLHSNMIELPAARSGQSQIDKARNYIANRIGQTLTIADVARAIGMSRSQFIKMFQHETGKSFTNYVIDYRLERARALLRGSDWSIQTIGEIVGLSTPRLRELFHKHFNQSPSDYRREAQGAGGVSVIEESVIEEVEA